MCPDRILDLQGSAPNMRNADIVVTYTKGHLSPLDFIRHTLSCALDELLT
jgi:hypothetical protein